MSTDILAEAWKTYFTEVGEENPENCFRAGFYGGLGIRLKGQNVSILKILEEGMEIAIGAVEGLKEEGERIKIAKKDGTKPESPLEGPGSPLSVAKAMAQGIQKRVGNERLAEFIETIQKRTEDEDGTPEEIEDEPTAAT